MGHRRIYQDEQLLLGIGHIAHDGVGDVDDLKNLVVDEATLTVESLLLHLNILEIHIISRLALTGSLLPTPVLAQKVSVVVELLGDAKDLLLKLFRGKSEYIIKREEDIVCFKLVRGLAPIYQNAILRLLV